MRTLRIAVSWAWLLLMTAALVVALRLTRYTPLGREAGILVLDRWKHEVCAVRGDVSRCFPIRR